MLTSTWSLHPCYPKLGARLPIALDFLSRSPMWVCYDGLMDLFIRQLGWVYSHWAVCLSIAGRILVEADHQFSGTNPGSRDLRGSLPNPFTVALVHDPTRFDASNELAFVVIPTALLFYANLFKSRTCDWYGDRHKCLHFFSFHGAHR